MIRALALCLALVLAAPASAETLRIGTSDTYYPYIEFHAYGPPTGLDADLARALCDRAGWDCTFVVMPVAELIPALRADQVDFVMGGIGYSVARDRLVDFTCPHHLVDEAVGTFFSARDAAPAPGARVGAVADTLHEVAVQRRGYQVVRYASDVALARAFVAGAEPLAFGSEQLTIDLNRMGARYHMVGSAAVATTGAAIAVAEHRRGLLDRLNALLAEISADGTLARFQRDWLQIDQGDVIAKCKGFEMSELVTR